MPKKKLPQIIEECNAGLKRTQKRGNCSPKD